MGRVNTVVGMLLVCGCVMVVGCEKKAAPKATGAAPQAPAGGGVVIPASFFVETAPADPKGIVELKKGVKAGDSVVMHGRIAGREDPFTAGRASFMMTDMTLPVCEDGCKTPWDHCCDDAKEIAANAATAQLVDEKGEVIKAAANGVHGLKPNAEVIVVGKVKSKDDAGNLVVDVTKVFVKG
jgi:hypothetical protein